MYKKDNMIVLLLIIIFLIISIFYKIKLTDNDISNFITFFTVYLGFMLTSFAIMAENKEIKKLYWLNDIENNNISCLYRLANYFKWNFGFTVFSLVLLLLTNLFSLEILTSKLIIGLLFATLYTSGTLIKILLDIFTNKIVKDYKEAK